MAYIRGMPKTTTTKARRERGSSPHPGVILLDPKRTGRSWWIARITGDPNDPRPTYAVTLQQTTKAQAIDFARTTSQRIVRERLGHVADRQPRLRLALWADDAYEPSSLRRYLEWFAAKRNKRKQLTSRATLATYQRECIAFVRWLRGRGVTYCHELTKPLIAEWRDQRFHMTATNKPGMRAPGTINIERKAVRLFLRRAIGDGHMPQLHIDEIYRVLALEQEAEPARRFLLPPEYAATLGAAIHRDALPTVRRHIGPPLLLDLKLGFRREELSLIRVSDVTFGGPWGAVIAVRDTVAKFGKARNVQCLPFSPLAVELLAQMCRNRGPDEYISDLSYKQLGDVIRKLVARHGAPADYHAHCNRRTSVCYAGPMQVSETVRTEQWGHDADTAAKSYAAARGHLPMQADSMDAVVAAVAPAALALERAVIEQARYDADRRKPAKRVRERVAQRYRPIGLR